MSIIGYFTKDDARFTGIIRTLAFTAPVTIEPVMSKRGDKSPDYRLFVQSSGANEIGAAWQRSGGEVDYISITIDDPIFPAPLNCRLVKTGAEHGYSLIWERNKTR